MHDSSTRLRTLLDEGDTLLNKFENKKTALVTKLDCLSMTYEDDPAVKDPADTLRYQLIATFSPYIGKFREKGMLVSTCCLFSSEPVTTTAPVIPAVVSHPRKDYTYLKPSILSADCTRRELSKIASECRIWLEKSLSVEDREDSRLVWASVRAVIDDEWTATLSRDQKISEKGFEEIYKIMDKVLLEKKIYSSCRGNQH